MRPKIICHMVTSIDGRLLPDRWTYPANGADKGIIGSTYEDVAKRLNADGWMIGRNSMAYFARGEGHEGGEINRLPRSTFVADPQAKTFSVSIDRYGKLHYHTNIVEGNHVVAVLGQHVSDAYLHELRKAGVSYVFAGVDGNDLPLAMACLGQDFGMRSILLEGGGLINGAFLKAGLIDEISLLIYPGVDGLAGISSIFEYVGKTAERPGAGQSLRHVSTETLEAGMVWLRYSVEQASA